MVHPLHLQQLLQLVADVDDGHAGVREAPDQGEQSLDVGPLQAAGGLVHQEQVGVVREGQGEGQTVEPRRKLEKRKDLGDVIVLDQERCIQCSRCIRFCDEITKTSLQEHYSTLAGDAMEGRFAGSDGYQRAADYVAGQFAALGLEPAGEEGWFQQVPLVSYLIDTESATVYTHRDGADTKLTYREDFGMGGDKVRESNAIRAEVVYVGYGVHAPDLGYSDYDGVDVDGDVFIGFVDRVLLGGQRNRSGGVARCDGDRRSAAAVVVGEQRIATEGQVDGDFLARGRGQGRGDGGGAGAPVALERRGGAAAGLRSRLRRHGRH